MKFTFKWLQSFIDLKCNIEKVVEVMSEIGLEVENYTDKRKLYSGFLIADIIETKPHPNANKLIICKVHTGKEILQIVCGGANVKTGMKVIVATIGSTIPSNGIKIKKSKIRGVDSMGMLCSEAELLLGKESGKIIEICDRNIEVGSELTNYYGLSDSNVDINITPNRGDCTSIYGIARDLAAKQLGVLTDKYYSFTSNSFKFGNGITGVNILIDSMSCYELALCKINNINNERKKIGEIHNIFSLLNIQSHSPLVDISNFTMYEFGRPNHIYDADKIKGDIKVRYSHRGEYFKSLDGIEYELPGGILVVVDEEKILSVAGVIGGDSTRVSEQTTSILIEVANFSKEEVLRSSRILNVKTDSSFRFERRIDGANTSSFMYRLVELIVQYCQGKLQGSTLIINGHANYISSLKIDYEYINKIIGVKINKKEVDHILYKLGFLKQKDNLIIPSWRRGDIKNNLDIVEEIVRIKGIDSITQGQSIFSCSSDNLNIQVSDKISLIRNVLVNRKIYEVVAYSFIKKEYATSFLLEDKAGVKISNPISSELSMMRTSMIPGLLKIINSNILKNIKDLSFFEIGKTYKRHDNTEIKEENLLTVVRTGYVTSKNIFSEQRQFDFYDSKDDFFSLLLEVNLSPEKLSYVKLKNDIYHPGKSLAYYINNKLVGIVGEIHPSFLKKFCISQQVYCTEVFLDNLPNNNLEKKSTFILPQLQSFVRDFAFYIDEKIESYELVKLIKSLSIDIIERVEIFDIYRDLQKKDVQKSVALTVEFQPKKKSLVEEEICEISARIVAAVEEKFSGSLRDSL